MEDFKIPILKNEEDAHKKAKECLVKLFDDKMLTIDNIKSLINDFHKKNGRFQNSYNKK